MAAAAVVPHADPQLPRALEQLEQYQLLVLTSQEAVAQLAYRAQALGVRLPSYRGQVAVVGEATRRAVERIGLAVSITPEAGFSQAGLIQALSDCPLEGWRVLWPRGDRAAPHLAQALRERGAMVDEVVVYRTEPRPLSSQRRADLREGRVRAVVYTAPSQVEFLCQQLDPAERKALGQTLAFSIGPETSRALARWHLPPVGEAWPSTFAKLAELVRDHLLH
ncbi:MAG: uroporphyrinogen-III synthase [Firmicutes bacterium]|nr:uroporphyrinogen-III synthase [Bacillota bacterium]